MIYSRLVPIFLVLGFFLPSLSLEVFNIGIDRVLFKALGLLFVVASFFTQFFIKGGRIAVSDVYLLIPVWLFFFSFYISEALVGSEGGAFVAISRFLAVLLFSLTLVSLKFQMLKVVRGFTVAGLVTLSLISVVLFVLQVPGSEKFSGTDLYSNKSLIFEQNVFGISVYLLFVILTMMPGRYFSKGLALFAIFSSFYRTVYIFAMLRVFLLNVYTFAIMLAIGVGMLYYFFDILYITLKLDQAATLTGRDVLWSIALDGFTHSPLIGNGESSIPEFSNEYLNRDPAFTTFHNIFFDVLYIGGGLGFLFLILAMTSYFYMFGVKYLYLAVLIVLPALLNTYYPFALNILGGVVGVLAVYHYRLRTQRGGEGGL